MIKKIVHVSDLHIRTFQLHDMYRKQFKLFIDDVKERIGDCDYDEVRVVITGDIAHQKINISNEQSLAKELRRKKSQIYMQTMASDSVNEVHPEKLTAFFEVYLFSPNSLLESYSMY